MDPGSISAVIPRYLITIFLLLLGGAYFAAAETAFASVSRIRMISDADDGDKRAKKVLYILDNTEKALTTVLIGNNIMHIGCSSVATLFASKIWGNSAVTAATFITTFVVFFFAEMIPKSYAKACNERLAKDIAGSLIFVMKLLSPVSFVFAALSKFISRIFGRGEEDDVTVSEEELFDIIENIDEEDKIDEDSAELVQSALEFTTTSAKDVLVPWSDVCTIEYSMPDEELTEFLVNGHYSRYPVMEDGEIIGILLTKKYLRAKLRGRKVLKSKNSLDKPYFVCADTPIDELLEDLSSHRTHFAVVMENESVLGIVTVEDILEALVGEIYDEKEDGGEDQ